MPTSFLAQLDWRFATKSFDPNKKVSDADLALILKAIRMAPTSAGLQPFHVFVITDPVLRAKIKESSGGQAQVADASHLLIFCVRSDVHERISAYIGIAHPDNTIDEERRLLIETRMKKMMGTRSGKDLSEWAARQTYLAMGFGLAACAELGIDSCPMEGFNTEEVDALLHLPPHLNAVAYVTLGYRTEDPARAKVRFPEDELFTKK